MFGWESRYSGPESLAERQGEHQANRYLVPSPSRSLAGGSVQDAG